MRRVLAKVLRRAANRLDPQPARILVQPQIYLDGRPLNPENMAATGTRTTRVKILP